MQIFQHAPPAAARLIERGNFSPPVSPSAKALRYSNGINAFLTLGCMNVFWGSTSQGIQYGIDLPARPVYTLPKFNVKALVGWLVSAGFTSALLTITETGFLPYESEVKHNLDTITLTSINPKRSSSRGAQSPQQPGIYCVDRRYAWGNLVQAFFAECKRVGLGTGFYFNSSVEMNLTDVWTGGNPARPADGIPAIRGMSAERQGLVLDFMCRKVQEMTARFRPDYWWLDNAEPVNIPGKPQLFYNAIKSIDSSCVVIGNAGPDNTMAFGPYDVEGHEAVAYQRFNAYPHRTSSRTFGGVARTIPQDLTFPLYDQYQQYYPIPSGNRPDGVPYVQRTEDDYHPDQPFVKDLIASPATIQAIVNEAKAYNCAVTMNVFVDQFGQVVQQDKDLIAQLNFAGA